MFFSPFYLPAKFINQIPEPLGIPESEEIENLSAEIEASELWVTQQEENLLDEMEENY